MTKKIRSFVFAAIAFLTLATQAFALPEYKTSYLRERVKGTYITNNKILGSVKQFFPYIGYLCSPETSTIFFTEDRETKDYYSLSSKRLYQWDGTYLRYLGDLKEQFQKGSKFYVELNAELYTSELKFEGKENGITYYKGSISGTLIGGWKIQLGFDEAGKIVSVKEYSDLFSFKPNDYFAFFEDMPEFALFELTSKEVWQWVQDNKFKGDASVESKEFYDKLTQNNWKTLSFTKDLAPYLADFEW